MRQPSQTRHCGAARIVVTLTALFSSTASAQAQVDKAAAEALEKKTRELAKWWTEHRHSAPRVEIKAADLDSINRDLRKDSERDLRKPSSEDARDDLELARDRREDQKITERVKSCGKQVFSKDPLKRAVKAGWDAAIAANKQPGVSRDIVINAACDAFNQRVKEEEESIAQHPDDKMIEVLKCVLKGGVVEPVTQALKACVASGVRGETAREDCFRANSALTGHPASGSQGAPPTLGQ